MVHCQASYHQGALEVKGSPAQVMQRLPSLSISIVCTHWLRAALGMMAALHTKLRNGLVGQLCSPISSKY